MDEEEILQPEEEEEEQGEEEQPEEEQQDSRNRGRQRKKKKRRKQPEEKPKDQSKDQASGTKPSPSNQPEAKPPAEVKPSSGVSPSANKTVEPSVPKSVSGATIPSGSVSSMPTKTPSLPKSGSIPSSSSLGGASSVANIGKTAMAGGEQVKELAKQGLNIGWNGMKAAMSPFIDDETKERLQNIENNVRGGVDGINRAINAPREIAEKVKEIYELPKKIQDTIKLVKELPERIKQVQDILRTAKNVDDVINAYNTLMGGGEVVGAGGTAVGGTTATTTTGAAAATATATTAATAAGVTAGTAVAAETAAVVAPVVAETGVVVGAATGEAAVGVTAGVAATWPVWVIILIIVVVIVLVISIILIFTGGKNNINSLAGGSALTAVHYDNSEDTILIDRLKQKMEGCDPKLVIYEQGKGDIDWQHDEDTNTYFNLLDRRLLKTIDYLTDNHRIKIALLKTGAPKFLESNVLTGMSQFGQSQTGSLPENWDFMTPDEQREYMDSLSPEERQNSEEFEKIQTISAFSLGQAMAIVEIDRSNILELQLADVNNCGILTAAPIRVSWQKTMAEKAVRTSWEELEWLAGQLDKLTPQLDSVYKDTSGVANSLASDYKLCVVSSPSTCLPLVGYTNLWSNTPFKSLLSKITRVGELLSRTSVWDFFSSIDPRTLYHTVVVLDDIAVLNNNAGGINLLDQDTVAALSDQELADIIKSYGSPEMIAVLRNLVSHLYKMTQVANMSSWPLGVLPYREAYESRNKIRQVITELLKMPTKVDLYTETPDTSDPAFFDEAMVVKQIVTFSPEDDLDNGSEFVDVFPFGLDGVGVGGVSMNNSAADGVYTYEDQQFSHSPIDNGVFSKSATQFVFNSDTNPYIPDIIDSLTVPWNNIDDRAMWLIGGLLPSGTENTVTVSYQKFLYVAF